MGKLGKSRVHPGGQEAAHKAPRGVPISVVAKVSAHERKSKRPTNDLRFSASKVSVEGGGDFDFDFVYGPDATAKDMADRTLRPLIRALTEGVSVCVVVFGSCASGKTALAEQLLPVAVADLFQALGKGSKGGAKRGQQPFQVRVSAVEIFDEVVQDLFNAENRDLRVVHDEYDGNCVSHASVRGPYRDVDQALEVLADSFGARTNTMSDFGPASRHTNTLWRLDVQQTVRAAANAPESTMRSRLTFVEVAGTEKLAEDRTTVRAREGPTLSKSVLAIQSVGDAFARGEQDFAVFSESKLTQLLEDSLVGNSVTLGIASLTEGEPDNSAACAQLAQVLRKGATFPTVNDERVQGLIRMYRVQLNRLRDELSIARNGAGGAGRGLSEHADEDVQELTLKINELEGRVVKDNLEKLRMKEDKEKIYAKLVDFREKYNQMVEQKSHLQSSTIKGEEEKLKISKALLDLRIENNRLVERCEADKYELVTKLLNAENEILQFEMKEEAREKHTTALRAKLAEAKKVAEEHKLDLIQMQDNYTKIDTQFKQELNKNEELGVELLNLVNQKNAFAKEAEELRGERGRLAEHARSLDAKHGEILAEKAHLEDALSAERKRAEQLHADKLRAELELQRLQVDFETQRLDMDKAAADLNRERDSELSQTRAKLDVEAKRAEQQREALQAEVRDAKMTYKLSMRKVKELEGQLAAKSEEMAALKAENIELNEKVNSLAQNYRAKLIELMGPGGTDGNADGLHDEVERERERLQEELVHTFTAREREMEKKLKALQQSNLKIVEKNRALFSRYTACKNCLEDMDVDAAKVEHLTTSSEEDAALQVTHSDLEAELRKEIAQGKERADNVAAELREAQEKNLKLVGQLKRAQRESDLRCSDLQTELKMLERQKVNLEEENHALSQRAGASGAGGPLDEETRAKMDQAQEALLRKIEELQGSVAAGKGLPQGQSGDASELQRQNWELQQRLQASQRELEQYRGGQAFPGGNEEELKRLREENEKLRQLYARRGTAISPRRASGNQSPGAIEEPTPSPPADGRSYADLLTRCTVAEEELSNYKTYMKKALAKAQIDIKQLKEERDMWKRKAGG